MTIIIYQFMVNSPGSKGSHLESIFDDLSENTKIIINWVGLKKYDDPLWRHLSPYIILFSLAILLYKYFKRKINIEKMQLITINELSDEEENRR